MSDLTLQLEGIAAHVPTNGNYIRLVAVNAANHIAELEKLLGAAACPNCGINKDGAYYDNYGEVRQCQWCYEVKQAIPAQERDK